MEQDGARTRRAPARKSVVRPLTSVRPVTARIGRLTQRPWRPARRRRRGARMARARSPRTRAGEAESPGGRRRRAPSSGRAGGAVEQPRSLELAVEMRAGRRAAGAAAAASRPPRRSGRPRLDGARVAAARTASARGLSARASPCPHAGSTAQAANVHMRSAGGTPVLHALRTTVARRGGARGRRQRRSAARSRRPALATPSSACGRRAGRWSARPTPQAVNGTLGRERRRRPRRSTYEPGRSACSRPGVLAVDAGLGVLA